MAFSMEKTLLFQCGNHIAVHNVFAFVTELCTLQLFDFEPHFFQYFSDIVLMMQITSRRMQKIVIVIQIIFADGKNDPPPGRQRIRHAGKQFFQTAEISKNICRNNQIKFCFCLRKILFQLRLKQMGIDFFRLCLFQHFF